MDVVAYCRCSTEEQGRSGLGLAAQRKKISETCVRRGWTVVAFAEDEASGGTIERQGLERAVAFVGGGGAQALVVARLDRLTRSLVHFADLMEQARREGWALVALDVDVDTTTAAGEALVNVLATFAQFERRLISERREALAARRARGLPIGGRPLPPDHLGRRIKRMRARHGWTLERIAAKLNAKGVPTTKGGRLWRPSSVAAVLDRAALR
jgi:DNA invertase Pin-like site-specific DNA recombinase